MTNLPENIRALRVLKNLSQEYMADSLELSQSAYGKLERYETRLTWERICLIAAIFQMTPREIVNFNPTGQQIQRLSELEEFLQEEFTPAIHPQIAHLNQRVYYLEQMNDLLQKQLADKTEIIRLIKINNSY